ncbi:MAG: HTH-type transcriptional regulator Xre [Synergistetes bacterium ADurb.Bin520]|nr:MAG: HTH-type transcriptional regulator Xre [Synergistetes bacterium ADurb.Bin520]
MSIGHRLKDLRAAQNLTAQQLADMMGVSRPHITQVENGRRGLSVDLVQALEEATGVNTNWLLLGKGDMFSKDTSSATSASTQDLDEFMRLLAGRHPDVVLHLRSIIRGQNALTEKDRRALLDLISIAMEQASDAIKSRVKDVDPEGI